jgi:hypothetical protein
MRRGINWREDYDPTGGKKCSKCPNLGHHEYECPDYITYNMSRCTNCEKYHHLTRECKERGKLPPAEKSSGN